jgi:hypothetical protein
MAVTWFVTESFIGEIQTRAHHRQASNRSLSAAVKLWVCGLKKNQKKLRKKLASRWPFPLDREVERQIPHFAVQKKFGKSEKKACQHSRN